MTVNDLLKCKVVMSYSSNVVTILVDINRVMSKDDNYIKLQLFKCSLNSE